MHDEPHLPQPGEGEASDRRDAGDRGSEIEDRRAFDDGDGRLRQSVLDRRRLIAGGLGALAVAATARAARADDVEPPGAPMRLGDRNVADETTTLTQDGASPAFVVENPSGPGVAAASSQSATWAITDTIAIDSNPPGVVGVGERVGVIGVAPLPDGAMISIPFDHSVGVLAASANQGLLGVGGDVLRPPITPTVDMDAGVIGLGPVGLVGSARAPRRTAVGVLGGGAVLPDQVMISIPFATRAVGVLGSGPVGVWGDTRPGPLSFDSDGPIAVLGATSDPDAVAVVAHNPEGIALRTTGRVAFSCGGSDVIPARSRSFDVADPAIAAETLVMVTLAGDTGAVGVSLHHVEVSDGNLRVVLTAPARRDTPFSYFCFERP